MRWLLVCLLLADCGGGGGGVPTTPAAPSNIPLVGYFETEAATQLPATAAGVDLVHCQDDIALGNPAAKAWRQGQQIACLQQAQALGIHHAIVGTAYLTFDAHYRYTGNTDLAAFCRTLQTLGLYGMVDAWYVLDEPDLHTDAANLTAAAQGVASACPGPALATIYGRAPIAQAAFNWIGRDDYSGNELGEQPPLLPGQRWIIPVGGANPYRLDPHPYVAWAQTHDVAALLWFIWRDYTAPDDTVQLGIGNNGLLPEYQAAGAQIVAIHAP